MNQIYIDAAQKLKALSDPKRLEITDMLSCGEICACRILEYFKVSQPTLSHDMKVLLDAGIIRSRREGKNIYYSLQEENLAGLENLLRLIFSKKEHCICENLACGSGNDYPEDCSDEK